MTLYPVPVVTDFEPATLPQETWLKPSEVAGYLRVNNATVSKWIRDGKLPGIRVGRSFRVLRTDVLVMTGELTSA